MNNKSGIYPCGNHILVKPDVIPEKTEGGIIVPPSEREKHKQMVAYGYVIALGPDCFIHSVETMERFINDQLRLVERRVVQYSKPFAAVGDRISFAVHSGRYYMGIDGEEYRMMNDTDITALVAEGVTATSLEARRPVSN